MNRIVKQFDKSFDLMKHKTWPQIYVGIDIHETVLKPTWSKSLSSEYYPFAKETLQLMSYDPEVNMILWSCSLKEFNREYHANFKKDFIDFNYINENPECKSTHYADFESKLYCDVGIDDKFAFMPHEDWSAIYEYFLMRKKLRRIDA